MKLIKNLGTRFINGRRESWANYYSEVGSVHP